MKDLSERMALGTAQLGMRYGVANAVGQPSVREAVFLVGESLKYGVTFFDTAQGYGESEAVLGRCIAELQARDRVRIITKLHPDVDPLDETGVNRAVDESCKKLGVPSLWGLLLHREQWLDAWGQGLGATMKSLRKNERTRHVGVSIYEPPRALQALRIEGIDAIQVPSNVFDRRLLRAGFFAEAERRGIRVFVRSAYLQGLALMSPDSLPRRLSFARPALEALHRFCGEHHVDVRKFCLEYVAWAAPVAVLVLGAELAAQVRENCNLLAGLSVEVSLFEKWNTYFPVDDPTLTNPSLWPAA